MRPLRGGDEAKRRQAPRPVEEPPATVRPDARTTRRFPAKAAPTTLGDDPLWYKDAVIYELHVRSFKDSNDDGIGDFPGLIQKLDHIASLGATAIWILPFYPSPLRDDGYDIADYHDVNTA